MWKKLSEQKPKLGQHVIAKRFGDPAECVTWTEEFDKINSKNPGYKFYEWCPLPPRLEQPLAEIVDDNITAPQALHPLLHKLLNMQRRPSLAEEVIQQNAIDVLNACEHYFTYGTLD